MLKSYLVIAWRTLRRNKVLSIINIGGLMIGLTTGIIISLVVFVMVSFDRFHEHYRDIHVLEYNYTVFGNIETTQATPGLLGPLLHSQIPELKYVVRSSFPGQSLVRYGEKSLYQNSVYTEPDFFRMMTFPALEGDPAIALRENSVVITQRTAKTLFDTDKALGKTIVIDNLLPLKVGAVIRDIPESSSIDFDLILPFANYQHDHDWVSRWDNISVQTWVQIQPNTNLPLLNSRLTQVLLSHTSEKKVSVFAYPMSKLLLYDSFKNGKPAGGKIYLVITLALLAGLVILIACINFMNLSTALAEGRAREVGLRKVLGASRRLIIGQFLGEAVFLSMLALLLSIALAYLVLPWFAAFSNVHVLKQFGNKYFWLTLILLGLVTGLVAGSYPAFYLSRFQPAKVLKRLFSTGRGGSGLRQLLVTFQFVISIFLIITVIVLLKQEKYLAERPMGYELSNLIDINTDGDLADHFDLFKSKLKSIRDIGNITAENDNLIGIGSVLKLDWPGKTPDRDFPFFATWVQYDWTKTIRLKMEEGRDFDPVYGADSSACLINQTAVRKMGLKEPIVGTRISGKTVIGVIHDFVFNNPSTAIAPLIVYLGKGRLGHVLVRLNSERGKNECLGEIEKIARSLNPFYPFVFHFTVDNHQRYFAKIYGLEQLVTSFGGMAILISCLGLFGLAGFIAERRTKEMSIRKVLGAGPATIWLLLTRAFIKPVFLGLFLACPLAALALSKMLSVIDEYHIRLSWWMFAVPGLVVIALALATVTYHGTKTALVNPANALRTE